MFPCGPFLRPASDDRKHKRRGFLCGVRGPQRGPPSWPRHRRRGFWHTLAAEWFQLRISVITFRSVIYSWPLAATHDPLLPRRFDQRKRRWLRKQRYQWTPMDLLPASSLLSRWSRVLILAEGEVSSYRISPSPPEFTGRITASSLFSTLCSPLHVSSGRKWSSGLFMVTHTGHWSTINSVAQQFHQPLQKCMNIMCSRKIGVGH